MIHLVDSGIGRSTQIALEVPSAHYGYDAIKRGLDILGAVLLLLALTPLFAVLAVLVKISSPGPVFFRHERCGRNGRPIRVTKFRTMWEDAEERAGEALEVASRRGLHIVDGPAFKSKDDPRITGAGRFLRRYSLDELPQLFDVLRGSMSLVGPRPLVTAEIAALSSESLLRLTVKPGLTCTWQVSGRNHVAFEDRMRMDVEYVQRRSIALDLLLIAKTPLKVLSGEGAF